MADNQTAAQQMRVAPINSYANSRSQNFNQVNNQLQGNPRMYGQQHHKGMKPGFSQRIPPNGGPIKGRNSLVGGRFGPDAVAGHIQQDSTFQYELIEKLWLKNDSMEKNLKDMTTSIASSLQELSKSFVPILARQDRENQTLKRLLRDRLDLKDDDEILEAELGQRLSRHKPAGNHASSYQPYKRQKVEQ